MKLHHFTQTLKYSHALTYGNYQDFLSYIEEIISQADYDSDLSQFAGTTEEYNFFRDLAHDCKVIRHNLSAFLEAVEDKDDLLQ